jgi:hypothetical protein
MIQVIMTDGDIVHRVHDILDFGTIVQRTIKSGKTAWKWTVTHQVHAAGLMMTLLPFMGERRSAKIMECLGKWKDRAGVRSRRTKCKYGHPLSGDNLYIYVDRNGNNHRWCLICRNIIDRTRDRQLYQQQESFL